jgi:hypothetical protein
MSYTKYPIEVIKQWRKDRFERHQKSSLKDFYEEAEAEYQKALALVSVLNKQAPTFGGAMMLAKKAGTS